MLPLFRKTSKQKRHDISQESSAGRWLSCNIIPYFCQKLGKMSQNVSSAAVVIGALRVKIVLAFKISIHVFIFDKKFD